MHRPGRGGVGTCWTSQITVEAPREIKHEAISLKSTSMSDCWMGMLCELSADQWRPQIQRLRTVAIQRGWG